MRHDDLAGMLGGLPAGPVPDGSVVPELLELAWDSFRGSEATRMTVEKLNGRIEELRWDSPVLSFKIERHGGTVKGSTRAELHTWEVNIEAGTATVTSGGYRQVTPRNPPLEVQPIAMALAEKIIAGVTDSQLRWFDDGSVLVRMGVIVPSGPPQQTVAGRRKRFRAALGEQLARAGWRRSSRNVNRFEPDRRPD